MHCELLRRRSASRIPYRHRSVERLGEGQHLPQVLRRARGADLHIGDRPQVSEIEQSMVGSTVIAYDPGAVDAEDHMQVLQCYIMHDIVVRPLEEGRVDIAIGQHARFRQSGAESDGVPFGDTDVEDAVRQLFLHDAHGAPGGHSRGDADDLLVLFRQL